jgi:hypothetical protein
LSVTLFSRGLSGGLYPTSVRRWSSLSCDICAWSSSDASSSISVVSVPFEVTGDGPTKSLGLMSPIGFDDMRAEEGLKVPLSVDGGGDDLETNLVQC